MATVTIVSPKTALNGDTIAICAITRTDAEAVDIGRTCTIAIYDPGGAVWWDEAGGAWGAAKVDNPMTEVNDADLPGLHRFDFNHGTAGSATVNPSYFVEVTSDEAASPTDIIVLEMRHSLLSQVISDAVVADPVNTLGELLLALKVVHTHNQVLDDTDKRLIFYREDGVATAMEFDLKDAAGAASVREPFEKERV